MRLHAYQQKRDFARTSEPKGTVRTTSHHRFVVQEHHASHLHYDLRLEMEGVLKSWAVPKGPSLDPRQKRLAVMVEDHPAAYLTFAGHIAEGKYGAGDVTIWDTGRYDMAEPGDPIEQLQKGKLSILFHGTRLRGEFHFVRLNGKARQWLLIKAKDSFAETTPVSGHLPRRDEAQNPARGARARATTRKKAAPAKSGALHTETSGSRLDQDSRLSPFPEAQRLAMPQSIVPMLATLINQPFSHPTWRYETKGDGVRMLGFLTDGRVRLVSRDEQEVTRRYPELSSLPTALAATTAIVDGEIVAADTRGGSTFQALQARMGLQNATAIAHLAHEQPVVYWLFELPCYDGFDLRAASLLRQPPSTASTRMAPRRIRKGTAL